MAASGDTAVAPTAEESTALELRHAIGGMLDASIEAYGDVVRALGCDLTQVSEDMADLEWLAGTAELLENETAYRAAVERLAWWDGFLAQLPFPRLLSEGRQAELDAAWAERARARLYARDHALQHHQERVAEELGRPDLDEEQREELFRIHEGPEDHEWRVDPEPFIQAALDALPPPPTVVPITREDIDPTTSFAGFNAVEAMRNHPALGPMALRMDDTLAEVLRSQHKMSRRVALSHARMLTGIFWIALRRAMTAGSTKLATSITLVLATQNGEVQETFTKELLRSWIHYVETLPTDRRSLASRLPLIGRLFGGGSAPAPKGLEGPQAKRLTAKDPAE